MTKLEAWIAWCEQAGTKSLADEYTLKASSHGKAFSFAWDTALKSKCCNHDCNQGKKCPEGTQ